MPTQYSPYLPGFGLLDLGLSDEQKKSMPGIFQDLTSPAERRAMYENHMLEMAKDPEMTLQMAQKLDPTNRVKFESIIDWFNKHTYSYYDGEGVQEDYLTLFSKATKSQNPADYAKAADSF